MIPGPNVALTVADSVAYGRRFGLVTVAGTTAAALLPQLAFMTLGMTGSLILTGRFFAWMRWAGVVYLACLGVRAWRAPVLDLARVVPEARSAARGLRAGRSRFAGQSQVAAVLRGVLLRPARIWSAGRCCFPRAF